MANIITQAKSMDKSSHVLGSKLLGKSNQEERSKFQPKAAGHIIDFESYDPNDESSIIQSIEGCYISPIKAVIFAILSLTLLPLLAVKWYNKAYKFFLLSYTNIRNATKLIIHGPRILSTSHVRWCL